MSGQQVTEHDLRKGLEKARAEMDQASQGGDPKEPANQRPGVDDTASKSADPAVPDRTQG